MMTPSEEYKTNLAILKQIMGWELETLSQQDLMSHPDGSWFVIENDNHLIEQYRFCTNMSLAWKIVEKLSEEEGCGKFELDKHWDCEFDRYTWGSSFIHNEPFVDWEWADTAPMAICLAALKYRKKV